MKIPRHRPLSDQAGMTLVEIMISLLIGAFLLGGVLEIFTNSRQTYKLQDNLSRIQENGRFALDLIGRDVRMTSYWGCLVKVPGDIIGGNDTMTLKAAFAIDPTGTCGASVDTAAAYYTDPTSTISYSINNSVLRRNTNNQNNSLVEDVENMQILYGEDTNDTDNWANYYVTAANVVNWENVVSLRVSLLIRSTDDNLTSQPLAYTFNGVTSTPNDHRLRRVFTSTFVIRSRLP